MRIKRHTIKKGFKLTSHKKPMKKYELKVVKRNKSYDSPIAGTMKEVLAIAELFMIHNNYESDKLRITITQLEDIK